MSDTLMTESGRYGEHAAHGIVYKENIRRNFIHNSHTEGRFALRKILVALVSICVCQMFVHTAQANILVSPYYRYFLPQRDADSEPDRILDTVTHEGSQVTLFSNDRSHQFGIKIEERDHERKIQWDSARVQTIERRPFTARSSIFDDGLIFQYWKRNSLDGSEVLFGYTSARKVSYVRLTLKNSDRRLKLHEGRYFFCILNPITDEIVEAQGIGVDGRVLRTWNGESNYPARRTWLSFFVQTYPYVVSSSHRSFSKES